MTGHHPGCWAPSTGPFHNNGKQGCHPDCKLGVHDEFTHCVDCEKPNGTTKDCPACILFRSEVRNEAWQAYDAPLEKPDGGDLLPSITEDGQE